MDNNQYKQLNEQYLVDLTAKEGLKALRGGVYYEVLQSGDGDRRPNPRSKVTCHYKGMLINGKVFDSSYKRNAPATFRVNMLISGFQIALVNMCVGDHWRVYIPASMGYGANAIGDIPAYSTLIFEIELLEVMG